MIMWAKYSWGNNGEGKSDKKWHNRIEKKEVPNDKDEDEGDGYEDIVAHEGSTECNHSHSK